MKHFTPQLNEFISFPNHILIWIKSGVGWIEVDFKSYSNFENKVIFLTPNQPIKFVSGHFDVYTLEFTASFVQQSPDYRVLFKHLISLGYIHFSKEEYQLLESPLIQEAPKVLDLSTNQWFRQNPFKAQKEEYTMIFDLKDAIDAHFLEHWSIQELIRSIDYDYAALARLVKNRLGLTVKNLAQRKLLLESQKNIALTDQPIQEIAYDLGFRDPAYFNRFFKQKTALTPNQFREKFSDSTDTFIQELIDLIQQHHKNHRSTAFYADKTYMTGKALSRKVKEKTNLTVGELVRAEVIHTAKSLLPIIGIKATAFELGFSEANHFSAFFKKYTQLSPSDFLSKKYNS